MAQFKVKNGVGIIPKGKTTVEERAFDGCIALNTIFVPAKKADYYKECLPEKLHGIIVELPAEKK